MKTYNVIKVEFAAAENVTDVAFRQTHPYQEKRRACYGRVVNNVSAKRFQGLKSLTTSGRPWTHQGLFAEELAQHLFG